MQSGKVFGIGFHKTGTSSLGNALAKLGYHVKGCHGIDDPDTERMIDSAFKLVDRFDAFQDNPWPILYRELDERHPGSKFIMTIRSTEKWISSVVRHFGDDTTPMRQWIYGVGSPQGNEQIYIERYERHNREVVEYFRDRADDLLVVDLTAGEGWEKLCDFLGRDVPDIPFPHANSAEKREKAAKATLVRRILRRLTPSSQ